MANTRILVKVRGDGQAFAAAAGQSFGAAANVQPILSVPPQPAAPGAAAAPATGSTWLRVDVPTASANPWDDAYGLAVPGQGFAAAALNDVEVIEPDIEQSWLPLPQPPEGPEVAAAADRCSFLDQDRSGGKAAGPSLAWNLDDAFSELRRARDLFGGELADKLGRILIAHLDTGYDPACHPASQSRLAFSGTS